ncbi:MAG: carboxypeptidase regulatory-like domain-containing protein [Candidatus Acidiferrales bacterium]
MRVATAAIALYCLSFLLPGDSPSLAAKEKSKEKPYALVVGSVFTAEGFALPGVAVSVKRKTDAKPKWRGVSDARGEFTLRLPAESASYDVTTKSEEYENQTKVVEVAGREKERVDIVFRLARKK